MASFTTATDTVKQLIQDNWSLTNTSYEVYTKQEENGKALNQRASNEIIIGADDYSQDAMDLFKNFYDKEYTTIITVKSDSVKDGEKVFDELLRIFGENTSNTDIPNDWGTVSFDDINIDTPRFNNFKSTIAVTLERTGDDP